MTAASGPTLPTLAELEEAAAFVHSVMPSTPQYCWPLLCERAGAEVWVKHENHGPIGAFKLRGGLTYMRELKRAQPGVAGVIAVRPNEHIPGRNPDAVLTKGSAISFKTPQCRANARCSDVGNPPAPNLDQVLRRHETDLLIVHAYKIRGQPRKLAVQQDIRCFLVFDSPETLQSGLG